MSAPIFTSKRKEFLRTHSSLMDMVIGHMAIDIDRFIKISAGTPVKTGDMKSETRAFKTKDGQWRVESPKVYSEVQEKGQRMTGPGAPTQPFEHYTTPGTGKGWFQRGISAVTKNGNQYVDEAARALGL